MSPATLILDAAYRTLARKGCAQLSLRDVAAEAGVALSQIHYYFGSKEGLLAATATHLVRKLVDSLQGELAETPTGPDRLRRSLGFLRSLLQHDGHFHKVYLDLITMAAWSPEVAGCMRELHDDLVGVVLTEAGRTGVRCQSQPMARLVLAALDGLALQASLGVPEGELTEAFRLLERTIEMTLP